MASVSLDSVSLRFPDGTLGLRDIDLHIEDGEFLALVGPSGSGKTTLLRTIAGFVAPTAGTVAIGDRTVADPRTLTAPEDRGLGMVFQQHAVWPHWNVARNIDYPLRRSGVGRAERAQRVEEALDMVGLSGLGRRNPATLSGGQRQRVALARALVARPQVLLLDEALSALDEPLRDRLRLELHTLTRELGLTVVHVTHDRSEALALADRVAVLDGGRIQQIGTPAELVSSPSSAFVANFLSDATVVEGRLDDRGFQARDFALRIPVPALAPVGTGAGTEVCAAILPSDITVEEYPLELPPDGADERMATVRSALFTTDGSDLVLDWNGLRLRARTLGFRPCVGQQLLLTVHTARLYPTAAAALTPLPLEASV